MTAVQGTLSGLSRPESYFLTQQVLQASASLQQSAHLSLQQVSHAVAPVLQQLLQADEVAHEDRVAMAARARNESIVFIGLFSE